MKWQLTIERVHNGYILSHVDDEVFEGEETFIQDVITADSNFPEITDEQNEMKQLLEYVAEYFGMTYEKFAKDNLNITFDLKGHKNYEEPKENKKKT